MYILYKYNLFHNNFINSCTYCTSAMPFITFYQIRWFSSLIHVVSLVILCYICNSGNFRYCRATFQKTNNSNQSPLEEFIEVKSLINDLIALLTFCCKLHDKYYPMNSLFSYLKVAFCQKVWCGSKRNGKFCKEECCWTVLTIILIFKSDFIKNKCKLCKKELDKQCLQL